MILDMTEKVKTVIELYFLLPDFKSREQLNTDCSSSAGPDVELTELGYF